ncbi:MAG: YgiQ family radical SAM protein [Muribaculaceae bacterium]|nr:YgiQ family radical SAM protein [Muribaculaceae bacterium]
MNFLPTTLDEMKKLGWEQPDVILFSGDAYVDHPSFGAAVIGRVLEAEGFKVVIVPQPNWQDDLRDFRKFGRPRLFFGVSPGAMDSMVNHYTAGRRLRHDDAYTAGGRHGRRPDYPSIVYTQALKKLFPDVPVVIGGIEASLRRIAHYDYWQDKLRPSILFDSGADILIYGMGERPIAEIAHKLDKGEPLASLSDVRQTAVFSSETPAHSDIVLAPFSECLRDKTKQIENFKKVEIESNKRECHTIWQQTNGRMLKINPPFPPLSTAAIDSIYKLPFTRLPHPRYKGKTIPAYEMIRHSVTMHRGCYGGCAFCTISAHQGKAISSRSKESIVEEVKRIAEMPDYKGYISDLGGPSANMYMTDGKNTELCRKCSRPSCLHPKVCPNLNTDHSRLLDVYRAVDSLPEVKKAFVGSGVRYDLAMADSGNDDVNRTNRLYLEQLISRHVSGRLKVAPEHTSDHVLNLMRKPSFKLFEEFNTFFHKVNRKYGLNQQLIPYFISSHPGCREVDMAELAVRTKDLNFHLEQVQDFTPTPMTLATEMFYAGINPYTGTKEFTAKSPIEKEAQRLFFFWYKPDARQRIIDRLRRLHRPDLLRKLYPVSSSKRRK